MSDTLTPQHTVAVIGAAVAGAQVSRILADRGATIVLFEQNDRPFGKIEDGLPRWHTALRSKEFGRIQELLTHPRVHYVPRTRVGQDVDFKALVSEWGFSAVILANGVWRDRPLPVADADQWVGRGLIYQNPFIMSFNHANDPGYGGQRFDYPDGALVVGGGLASIDVVKVLMLENVRRKLEERGHQVDLEEMEKAGIPKTCEQLGLTYGSLGVAGATLIYRRRAEDMPLAEAPAGASPERIEKVKASRRKIIERAMSKFCFRFEPLASPEEVLSDEGRVVGLKLRRMAPAEGRKLVKTDQVFELRGSVVISSIGSIPEPIPGIQMKGELLAFTDWDLGRLEGLGKVFSAGNVVTGKGNIVASRRHSTGIGEYVASKYLGLDPKEDTDLGQGLREAAEKKAEAVAEQAAKMAPVSPKTYASLMERTRIRQVDVGYEGNLEAWIQAHPPAN